MTSHWRSSSPARRFKTRVDALTMRTALSAALSRSSFRVIVTIQHSQHSICALCSPKTLNDVLNFVFQLFNPRALGAGAAFPRALVTGAASLHRPNRFLQWDTTTETSVLYRVTGLFRADNFHRPSSVH